MIIFRLFSSFTAGRANLIHHGDCLTLLVFLFSTSPFFLVAFVTTLWYSVIVFYSASWALKRRTLRLSATLRYRVLPESSFISPISSLQLLLAVALDRRPAWRRVHSLNRLSSPYILTNHILATRAMLYATRSQHAIGRVIRDKQPLVTCPGSFHDWWHRGSNTVPCGYASTNVTTQP